jgi:hypothetical protein
VTDLLVQRAKEGKTEHGFCEMAEQATRGVQRSYTVNRQHGLTLNMEAISSSKTSVHTRSTRRHIPEDGILHSHRCENLKSYKLNICLFVCLLDCFMKLVYKEFSVGDSRGKFVSCEL